MKNIILLFVIFLSQYAHAQCSGGSSTGTHNDCFLNTSRQANINLLNVDSVIAGKWYGSIIDEAHGGTGSSSLNMALSTMGLNPMNVMKYSDTNSLSNRINLKYTTPSGTTSQYVRGDGSLATYTTGITTELDPTVPSYSKTLSAFSVIKSSTDPLYRPISYVPAFSDITGKPATLSGYGITDAQSLLVSGTNIKTINGASILGSGNIATGSGTVTSVGVSMPSAFTVSNSPITNSGTINITGAGTSSQVIDGTGALKTINTAAGYGTGTAYSLTTTSSKIDFGTTDPSITIPSPGTYLIMANLKIEYAGVTTIGGTASFKLRRTNNTAADLSNAITNFTYPALTLLSQTAGDSDIAPVIYTTSNSNDVIEMWGNRSGGLTLGNINVGEASVVAIRIY